MSYVYLGETKRKDWRTDEQKKAAEAVAKKALEARKAAGKAAPKAAVQFFDPKTGQLSPTFDTAELQAMKAAKEAAKAGMTPDTMGMGMGGIPMWMLLAGAGVAVFLFLKRRKDHVRS